MNTLALVIIDVFKIAKRENLFAVVEIENGKLSGKKIKFQSPDVYGKWKLEGIGTYSPGTNRFPLELREIEPSGKLCPGMRLVEVNANFGAKDSPISQRSA
jgi:hypothetical protein